MKFWADGSGWNGKHGLVCVIDEGGAVNLTIFPFKITNNQAEYLAVIEALLHAYEGDVIYTDSQLVADQLQGEYEVQTENLFDLFHQADDLLTERDVKIEWIPREQNMAGIFLDNLKKKGWKLDLNGWGECDNHGKTNN